MHEVNADECLMTRLQEMSLDYHFKIEQEAGSSMFAFFGFNGNNQDLTSYYIFLKKMKKNEKSALSLDIRVHGQRKKTPN